MSYDDRGRLNSLPYDPGNPSQGVISGVNYNVAGQVTDLKLGFYPSNYVTETYGYDANRMQLTSQTATKSGGAQNGLMNLTYYYQASAGQMGAGSTAGNAGQLMAINNNSTINGTTESAAYTYDNLGRLATSNQTSNAATAQRRFSYDRWGNRTGVWDAVTGGNQIQSVVLQQSGGAPTNQLTSVTTSGVTKNYTHDAAGNVTNDGAHSYTYDAENRIVSVDGGATAQYKYDHQNRRVTKTIGAAVTHYIWQGSQVIAEHDGTTPFGPYGSTPYGERSSKIDYVYAGSRMVSSLSYTHNCTTGLGGAIICTTSSTRQYYLSDRLSERVILDGNLNVIGRMAHLPFGEDFAESGSQEKHHFTTYERDVESGTDYAINRGYSANLGRFQQADPYKASGYIVDPQSWNRYPYAQNEPLNRIDPLGLDWMSVPVALINYFGSWVHLYGWGTYPSSGAGGGGKHGPLEDTGDGPGGGDSDQGIVTQQPSDDQKKKFREFLKNLSQKCKDKLAKLDSAILDKLSNAIGEVSVTDTDSIKDRKAIDFMAQQVINIVIAATMAGASSDETKKYGSMTVGQLFTPGFVPEAYGGNPGILTVPAAFGGPAGTTGANVAGIYAPGGLNHKGFASDLFNYTMGHELLHFVTGLDDKTLQDKEHLNTGGKDISVWLAQGCPDP